MPIHSNSVAEGVAQDIDEADDTGNDGDIAQNLDHRLLQFVVISFVLPKAGHTTIGVYPAADRSRCPALTCVSLWMTSNCEPYQAPSPPKAPRVQPNYAGGARQRPILYRRDKTNFDQFKELNHPPFGGGFRVSIAVEWPEPRHGRDRERQVSLAPS
jgi:hypothetical protein